MKNRIYSYDILRIICAVFIILCHFNYIPFGQFATYVFMGLSGFVVFLSIDDKEYGPGTFLYTQMIKIIPLYWTVTIASYAAGIMVPSLFRTVNLSVRNLILSLLFIPYCGGEFYPIYPIGWYMNSAIVMYTIVAVSMLINKNKKLEITTATVISLVVLKYVLVNSLELSSETIKFLGSDIGLVFVLGGWTYVRLRHYDIYSRRKKAFYVASSAIVFAILCIIDSRIIPLNSHVENLLCVLGTTALLILFYGMEDKIYLKNNKYVMELGQATMAVYLTHYFVVKFFERIIGFEEMNIKYIFLTPFIVLICLLIGWITHKYYEIKLIDSLKKSLRFLSK